MKTSRCLPAVLFAALGTALAAQTTPLLIEQTVALQFPTALSLTNLSEGEARVVVDIDPAGRLTDWLVSGYTHQAFADEVVRVLRQWRFTAPTENGRPMGVRTELRFDFKATGRVLSLTVSETPELLLRQMGILPPLITRVCKPHELDHPMAPLNPASPLYPVEAGRPTGHQTVMLDFYVDEQGQPRMPVVVGSTQPDFALAAIDALSHWRFPAPTRAGKPVTVRVRQKFIFPASS